MEGSELRYAEVSEEALQDLVATFYARVRQDPSIGPVFERAIEDWPEHLEKLQGFWSSVMLGTGRYKGRPMPAHIKHADAISVEAFERWLGLWRETTDALFVPGAAAALQAKASRIAESLHMGISFHVDPAAALRRSFRGSDAGTWSPPA